MAVNGRKPKPAGVKALGGRSHKKKEPPLKELPLDLKLSSDYWTMPEPRDVWDSLVEAGIAKPSDRKAFARYADLLEVYENAYRDVLERGTVLEKGEKGEKPNPSWRVMRDAQIELLKIEAEFGLTPSAKQRVFKSLPGKEAEEVEMSYAAIRRGTS